MACYNGEVDTTAGHGESWHEFDSPWSAEPGRSAIAQLCRVVDDRLNALSSGVRFIPISQWGIAPSDTKPAEFDYQSNPNSNPHRHFVLALTACKNKISDMLTPITLSVNGGIVHPVTCKRWQWSNVFGRLNTFNGAMNAFDFERQEDWQGIIQRMRVELDWMSGRVRTSAAWISHYGGLRLEEPYPPPLLGLPPVTPHVEELGGLHPSPGYDYVTSYFDTGGQHYVVTSRVKINDGIQTYDNAVFGTSAGGATGPSTVDIGIGWSSSHSDGELRNEFLSSYTRGSAPTGHPTPDPSIECPYGWFRRTQGTRRFYFKTETNPSGNAALKAQLINKQFSWQATLESGGSGSAPLEGLASGSLSPASGVVRYTGSAFDPPYVDITATMDPLESVSGLPQVNVTTEDDGIQLHKASKISLEFTTQDLEFCLNGCNTYSNPI